MSCSENIQRYQNRTKVTTLWALDLTNVHFVRSDMLIVLQSGQRSAFHWLLYRIYSHWKWPLLPGSVTDTWPQPMSNLLAHLSGEQTSCYWLRSGRRAGYHSAEPQGWLGQSAAAQTTAPPWSEWCCYDTGRSLPSWSGTHTEVGTHTCMHTSTHRHKQRVRIWDRIRFLYGSKVSKLVFSVLF